MKLINPSVEILSQKDSSIESIYSQITRCGKVCYASQFEDDPEKNKRFVETLINNGHTSVLEHGTVYLTIHLLNQSKEDYDLIEKYRQNKYSFLEYHPSMQQVNITTNYRVIVENGWFDDLKYIDKKLDLSSQNIKHQERITVKFIIDRALAQEFTRHRDFSFSMQSQRFCNYSKDKFGNEITFVIPLFLRSELSPASFTEEQVRDIIFNMDDANVDSFLSTCICAEINYFNLLDNGARPEEARVVLPNCTKTELIMTGTRKQWEHFFDLRLKGLYGKPHPDAAYIALKLSELMSGLNSSN